MIKPTATYLSLPKDLYSVLNPIPFNNIKMVYFNEALSNDLGMNEMLESRDGKSWLQGQSNQYPIFAQAYAGHQFGHVTMLGDGRAAMIGEWIAPTGRFDLQLKGSGPTPYSRNGDGKATLQSMAREYLISEAMHHLGVPTTRSLALFKTGEMIQRNQPHQGAMLVRVAASHIRVGTFEYARALDDLDLLKQLIEYTIHRHYPQCEQDDNATLSMFQEIVKRQAKLIAKWQSLGFVHGVMNTDNMAISGETIDYGPCAFLDEYDPNAVFSSIDTSRRYAYFRQPFIASWNLSKLATALLPLIDKDVTIAVDQLNAGLNDFEKYYTDEYRSLFGAKIGLQNPTEEDDTLISELLSLMQRSNADFTNTFATLSKRDYDALPFTMIEWTLWKDRWYNRIKQDSTLDDAITLMKQVNPVVIPRNHLVEDAVNQYDFDDNPELFETLLALYHSPFDYDVHIEETYKQPNPSTKRFVSYCGT